MKGRYYQGFIPPKPGEQFKTVTQEIEDKELSKEEFREYILNLTAKYDIKNSKNNNKQQSKVNGITTATLSDYCEIEEDTREDLESDSMNSARFQQPISNRGQETPKINNSSQNEPQFRMHYTLLKDKINRNQINKNQSSNYYPSNQSQKLTDNPMQNNQSSSYYYNMQQLPNVSKQIEQPLINEKFEDEQRDSKSSRDIIGKQKQSQVSSVANLNKLMRVVQVPSGSKISQMRFFNSKRAIFSSHSQKSDRSSGLSSATGGGGGCCLTTNSTINGISSRVIDSSNSNRSINHINNYSFNKTIEIKKDNNNNSSSILSQPIQQKQLKNMLLPLKNMNCNQINIQQGLFMEIQSLKVQRNLIENSNKTIKEKITLLEKDLRQTRKSLQSWGIKGNLYEEGLDAEWRYYDQQMKQFELREEKLENIYEDPNFYFYSLREKARQMNETIKELDETLQVQRDMIRKTGFQGKDQDKNRFEIQLAKQLFELSEQEEELMIQRGSSAIPGSSEIKSYAMKREELLKDLSSIKNSIQTLQTEITMRQTTNVSFEKSIDALISKKTKRDAEIQELKPKVDQLRKQFKEILENRKKQAQWWKQQDQQLDEGEDKKGRMEQRKRSNSDDEDKDSLGNVEKTMENKNLDDLCAQDARQLQVQDSQNDAPEDKVLQKSKSAMGINQKVRSKHNEIPQKSRTQRQVEQIHRQSAQLNELKLEYQLFRGAQMLEQQNWHGKKTKELGDIAKLKEMNSKLMNSIVKKRKILQELQKQKEKQKDNKIQEFQIGKEKELRIEEEEELTHGKDQKDRQNNNRPSELPYFSSLKVIQQQKLQLQQQEQFSCVSKDDLTQTTQQGQKSAIGSNNDSIIVLPNSCKILNNIEPIQENIEQSLCSNSCYGIFGDNLHFSGDEDEH